MTGKAPLDRTPLLLAAAAVLAAGGYAYYAGGARTGLPVRERAQLSAEQEMAAILKAARAAPPPRPAPSPPSLKAPWAFRGKVVELYRGKPVAGASLRFMSQPMAPGGATTSSDASGAYSIELPPLPKSGYYVEVLHRDCDPTFVLEGKAADWEQASWADRVRLTRGLQMRGPHAGRRGTPVEQDFALKLKRPSLTPEEAAKLDAVK